MTRFDRAEEHQVRVAQRSFAEVLDATKHQDDKIGRFLTAIAFLFTGAIAFVARSQVFSIRYELDGHGVALPGLLLGAFLVFSAFSVLFLLIALGPNLKLPGPERGLRWNENPSVRSRIFFLSIAGRTRDEWRSEWSHFRPTNAELLESYLFETHNLATKTDFKYSRTNEARALFTLGLLFLALSVVLGFYALAIHGGEVRQGLPWNAQTRVLVGTVSSLFALALAYDYWRLEQELDTWANRTHRWTRLRSLLTLVLAAPLYTWVLIVSGRRVPDWTVAIALASLIMASLALMLWGGLRWKNGWGWRLAGVALGLGGGYATAVCLRTPLFVPRLGLAAAVIVLLEAPRLLSATRLWHTRLGPPRGRRQSR